MQPNRSAEEPQAVLNSNELGEKGQIIFRGLCVDAKLICNPSSERDLTGWDFLVQFPFDPLLPPSTLDKRRSPLSCHVQVKTMWAHNDRFQMRLSSAEWLAREPKPSFIYIVKVNNNLDFVDAFIIHILDDALAKVLKRLRREQARGRVAVNRLFISCSPSAAGKRVPITGAALRAKLADCCGPTMDTYIDRKARQLQELGFEPRRYEFKVTFGVGSEQELVDGFLGLRKFDVVRAEHYETRFGIRLPQELSEGAEVVSIRIAPAPIGKCRIVISPGGLARSSVFDGEIFVLEIARQRPELLQFLIKSRFLTISIKDKLSTFSTTPEAEKQAHSVEDWIALLRLQLSFSRPGGRLTITAPSLKKVDIPLAIADIEMDASTIENLLEVFDGLQRLAEISGAPLGELHILDVEKAADEIIFVTRNLAARLDAPPFAFQIQSPIEVSLSHIGNRILYTNYFAIGETRIAYSALVELETSKTEEITQWKSTSVKICAVCAINDFPADYDKFVAHERSLSPTASVIIGRAAESLE
jgi:hypothetical protein